MGISFKDFEKAYRASLAAAGEEVVPTPEVEEQYKRARAIEDVFGALSGEVIAKRTGDGKLHVLFGLQNTPA